MWFRLVVFLSAAAAAAAMNKVRVLLRRARAL